MRNGMSVKEVYDALDQLDMLSSDYSYCEDASELLREYRDLIVNTEIDL